jgi:hypothetical protein
MTDTSGGSGGLVTSPGLEILFRFSQDSFEILRYSTTKRTRTPVDEDLDAKSPRMGDTTTPSGRIVVLLHKPDGRWAKVGVQRNGETGGSWDSPCYKNWAKIQGGVRAPRYDDRLFTLNLSKSDNVISLLSVFRYAQGLKLLGVVKLLPVPGFAPASGDLPNSIEWPFRGGQKMPHQFPVTPGDIVTIPPHAVRTETDPIAKGDDKTVVIHGKKDGRYRICMLGDGYPESALDHFLWCAKTLARKFLRTSPFNELKEHLYIEAILTASREWGISECPCQGEDRDTRFGVQGHWDLYKGAPTSPTFFGVEDYNRIYDMHRRKRFMHLYVVLANCVYTGGSAWAENGVAFVSPGKSSKKKRGETAEFTAIGIHEMAHVIANLRDEYISCDYREIEGPNIHYERPDFATFEVNRVPWAHLITHQIDGRVGIIHRRWGDKTYDADGDPIFDGGPTKEKDPEKYDELIKKVGLFWGANYIFAEERTPECNRFYDDPRGANFYRGMARCLMRRLNAPLCKVCQDALRKAVCTSSEASE